jgi:hypothetical protein
MSCSLLCEKKHILTFSLVNPVTGGYLICFNSLSFWFSRNLKIKEPSVLILFFKLAKKNFWFLFLVSISFTENLEESAAFLK